MSRNTFTHSMLTTALVTAAASAGTINVPGDQPTIQAGVTAASNGDVVVVAAGEYFENIDLLGKAITVRSTNPDDPAVVMSTIINGGGVGSVVTCDTGEGPATVLSGFVITGGVGSGFGNGGGMYNGWTSPTVTNCTFSGNTAAGSGGGIYTIHGDPTVTNCSFVGNTASSGGGMHGFESIPTVTNCTFIGNSANSGGGLENHTNSHATVTDCTFIANSATGGGGMYNHVNSDSTVTRCTFTANTTAGQNSGGGGMFNSSDSNPTVIACTFTANTTEFIGGGMANFGNGTSLSDCMFTGNSGIIGGGMWIASGSAALVDTGFCGNVPDPTSGAFTDGGGNSMDYCAPASPAEDPCPADLDGNNVVDTNDFLDLLGAWGACP